jgi:6-phosphogluconate dehydrogenase (decarboxylating) (EC 1.1.1.44)
MQLAVVGLGRMGANIARRVMKHGGHRAVVYDKSAEAVAALAGDSATGATSLEDLVTKLTAPRTVWVMLPSGPITEAAIEALGKLLSKDDVIIDGGNTFWQDDIRRGKALATRGIHYLDVGTSGGVWGLERGYCMMIGGDTGSSRGSIRYSRPWRRAAAIFRKHPDARNATRASNRAIFTRGRSAPAISSR